MENPTNLKDSLFIQLGYEENMPDTLCEVCAGDKMITEASHYAWGMELCVDCYMDGCD
tara:strand:- start:339 stop:512 length:174 start_codon:yes stop_codon:yes gene_type:complete